MNRRKASPFPLLLAALLVLAAGGARADQVWILAADRDAAEARIEVALAARQELLASYFIIGDDPLSLTSLTLLRSAARRGVQVKLLVDWEWSHIPPAVADHLRDQGVEIREYHPFRLDRLGWLFRRMHDKLLIGDGRELIVGGRNIESTYFGLGAQVRSRNYLDLDLRLRGEAAGEARRYFLALWASREVRPLLPTTPAAARAAAGRGLDVHQAWLDARIAAARADPGRVAEAPLEVGEARFLHDPIGRKRPSRGVGHELLELLGCAHGSAVVESPYLIPSLAFRRGLKAALGRGVAVRILTNSLASTDNLFAQAGYVGKKRGLVRQGVEIWEYQGPDCLHSKAAVIDGETVIVGSFNLDPRSEFLNTEVALSFRSPALGSELLRLFDDHLRNARRIDRRGYPEGATEPFPGIPRSKVFRLRLLQLLAPFLERQL
jgi:putative cardiolipin synthase